MLTQNICILDLKFDMFNSSTHIIDNILYIYIYIYIYKSKYKYIHTHVSFHTRIQQQISTKRSVGCMMIVSVHKSCGGVVHKGVQSEVLVLLSKDSEVSFVLRT